jgi:hypothetical protein
MTDVTTTRRTCIAFNKDRHWDADRSRTSYDVFALTDGWFEVVTTTEWRDRQGDIEDCRWSSAYFASEAEALAAASIGAIEPQRIAA